MLQWWLIYLKKNDWKRLIFHSSTSTPHHRKTNIKISLESRDAAAAKFLALFRSGNLGSDQHQRFPKVGDANGMLFMRKNRPQGFTRSCGPRFGWLTSHMFVVKNGQNKPPTKIRLASCVSTWFQVTFAQKCGHTSQKKPWLIGKRLINQWDWDIDRQNVDETPKFHEICWYHIFNRPTPWSR